MSTLNRKLKFTFEQKAETAARGECAAQRRLSEAEANMDIRNWEQRNYGGPFVKLIENSNIKDWNCTKRIKELIRLKERRFNLCGEFEMKNRSFRENRARDCQEN